METSGIQELDLLGGSQPRIVRQRLGCFCCCFFVSQFRVHPNWRASKLLQVPRCCRGSRRKIPRPTGYDNHLGLSAGIKIHNSPAIRYCFLCPDCSRLSEGSSSNRKRAVTPCLGSGTAQRTHRRSSINSGDHEACGAAGLWSLFLLGFACLLACLHVRTCQV